MSFSTYDDVFFYKLLIKKIISFYFSTLIIFVINNVYKTYQTYQFRN